MTLALTVVAVMLVVALWREYGPLWTDPAIYLILSVPVLPALWGVAAPAGTPGIDGDPRSAP